MPDFFQNITNVSAGAEAVTVGVSLVITFIVPLLSFWFGMGIGYLIGRRRRIIRRYYPETTELKYEYYQGRKDQIEGKPDKYRRKP
jgi:membrane protein DedA with SNARE-associated domain